MTVRSFMVGAVAATAVAGPAAATAPAPALATTSVQPTAVSSTVDKARSEADAIDLEVTRTGSLAMTLTWSGGSGPYDVMIDPSKGQGRLRVKHRRHDHHRGHRTGPGLLLPSLRIRWVRERQRVRVNVEMTTASGRAGRRSDLSTSAGASSAHRVCAAQAVTYRALDIRHDAAYPRALPPARARTLRDIRALAVGSERTRTRPAAVCLIHAMA
jgi:hypothetical protein